MAATLTAIVWTVALFVSAGVEVSRRNPFNRRT